MLVSEILEEVKEAIGKCSDAFALRTITRAVQLLANKNLIDPLIGYFDFSLGNDWFVALPRDCKTPLRININKQPAFSRARLYEFHINSEGTTDADEPGLSWSDRGYSPIQNEKALPGKLRYKVTSSADSGKGITVFGLDENGREQEETLAGHLSSPTEGAVTFHKIVRIIREVTAAETFLWCNGENIAAQYYADETLPEYRVIKLSKKAAAVRVMFRRHVFSVRTVDDFIPMHSHLAVVHACKAVRFLGTDEYDKAAAALAMAETFLREEQASREEHNTIASQQEVQPAIDASIYVRDSIIAADVYDVAADIFGPVGRRKLLDKMTTAIELLSNKGQWDPRLGVVDVFTADNRGAVTYDTPLAQDGRGHGFYVLPRHVETPVAINYKCGQTIPRNRWFEFHMNGDGGMENRSSCGTWDDAGDVCIIRRLPLDPTEEPARRRVLPAYLVAVPDESADNNVEVRIYGFERDANDKDVEVWRAGQRGWLCPCVAGSYDPGEDAPRWTAIERITKGESRAFIRLYSTFLTPEVIFVPGVPEVPYQPAVNGTPESPEVDTTELIDLPEPWTPPEGFTEYSAPLPDGFAVTVGGTGWPGGGNHDFHVFFNGVGAGGWQVDIYDDTEFLIAGGQNINFGGPVDIVGGDFDGMSFIFDAPANAIADGSVEGVPEGTPLAEGQWAGVIHRVFAAFVPADPALDVTTIDDPAITVAAATYVDGNGSPETQHAYLVVSQQSGFQIATLFADQAHTVPLASWSQEETLDTMSFATGVNEGDWGGVSSFSLLLTGFVALGDLTDAEFIITRTVQQNTPEVPFEPAIPETPAADAFWSTLHLYGMWYPDELEPKYRMIKLPHSAPARIRMAYRKRTPKLTSIYEPIPLRSRFAIEQMLRGIKASETDPTAAQAYEAAALRYLREERINQGPSATGILQYEESTAPGFTGNVQ